LVVSSPRRLSGIEVEILQLEPSRALFGQKAAIKTDRRFKAVDELALGFGCWLLEADRFERSFLWQDPNKTSERLIKQVWIVVVLSPFLLVALSSQAVRKILLLDVWRDLLYVVLIHLPGNFCQFGYHGAHGSAKCSDREVEAWEDVLQLEAVGLKERTLE